MSGELAYDEWFQSRSDEEKAALRAGALSWPDRKMQRWGHLNHWREAGPFDWSGCDDVEVVIGRLSGVPTLKNCRFSADNLLGLYEGGMSVAEILESYELDEHQVLPVLRFAGVLEHDAV